MSWSETIFREFVQVNPKVKLERGTEYSFIPMEIIEPETKFVTAKDTRVFAGGGARFSNGDTIFARITPCLEHGKIAKVKGLATNDGFGSTEYFVFRAISEKSDSDYVYYLSKSEIIKGPAIKSMVGSSGRQRADKDVVAGLKVKVPDIHLQKRTVDVLNAYDDLIENNLRRIELLENAARLIYKEWFVKLNFPGREHTKIIDGVPERWEKKKLGDVCQSIGGGTPSTSISEYWEDGDVIWVTPTDITRNKCIVLTKTEKKITQSGFKNCSARMLPPDTILMTSRASIGFFGLIDKEVCTNQGFISVIPNEENYRMYLLFNLISRKEEIDQKASGSTYKEINKTTFRDMDILMPSKQLLEEYYNLTYTMIKQIRIFKKSNDNLILARDILLPKLMTGEIAV